MKKIKQETPRGHAVIADADYDPQRHELLEDVPDEKPKRAKKAAPAKGE